MNHKIILFALLIFLLSGCNPNQPKIYETTEIYPEELKQLHRNVLDYFLEEEIDTEEVAQFLTELSDDGTWRDIDYPSKTRGYWSPTYHLSRMITLATAYQKPGSEFYQNPDLAEKIHAALNHWLNNDFQSPNWWHPVIGTPMRLLPTLILMEPELSAEQMAKALPILNRCEIGRTGQNKVWQSGNVLFTSLLTKNTEMIAKASASIQEELVVSTSEGVQPDWTYHQHGPQLQFGNYGLSYVGDMQKWIQILRGTQFKFDEEKVEILRNYLLKGQRWVTWKNEMDISACGRQIGPDQPDDKAKALSRYFVKMAKLDPEFANEYMKANDYTTLSGNKHFWRSDIQIQRTPDYYFSVKMASNRVIGAESCNSENLQGYYLGDGATYLYQTGNEYKNIFPFWDWKKIPGTTTLQDDEPLPVLTARGYRIPSDFVGGVSDGENGIAVLDYNRLGVLAKKSWFMFDDKIICLGAGINSDENLPVTTSVNQSYLNGAVEFKTTDNRVTNWPVETLGYKWILHDNIGYYFPNSSLVNLITDEVTGKWTDVTKLLSEEMLLAKIFKLYLEHGVNPEDQTYEYILVPNATKTELEQMVIEPPFSISNQTDNQEVIASNGNIAGIVFYEPGNSNVFGGIETDQPCLIMVKKLENGLEVSVADPTQKLIEINLVLAGEYSGNNITAQDGKTKINVVLPQLEQAGKTITLNLAKK